MKIAICSNTQIYQKNKILNAAFARNFPGTLWISILAKLLKKEGHELVTGDIATSNVKKGLWKPNQILIIAELDAKDAQTLIKLGSVPFILTGLESPLYAYKFYDKLPQIAPQFQNRFLYAGAFKNFSTKKGSNHPLYFPSFEQKNIRPIKNWNKRKFLVQVVSNKYWRTSHKIPLFKDLKIYPKWFWAQWQMYHSHARKFATQNELLTKRLEAIEYFGKFKKLDLFGPNWDKLTNLPQQWQDNLQKIIPTLNTKPIKNKLKTIANYKFAICFENVSYSGHITEKIIDCFVAGVIPIYIGAPDIANYIPSGIFIDFKKFKSWQDLDKYLSSISEKKAYKIIHSGRKFLNSSGKRYSYQQFAKRIASLVVSRGYN